MSDVDGDYEKKWEADEQELSQYDERAEGEGDAQQNPRCRLAPVYFADYQANRPSTRAAQSLQRAFRMWHDVAGVSGDVRAAVAQIQNDEEFEEDVWETLAYGITEAFVKDELLTEGLHLVDEFASRVSTSRGKAMLLLENGKEWYFLDNVDNARKNLNAVFGIDTSDSSWWVEVVASGFLHEIDNLNIGQEAPHFCFQDLDGHPVDLASYRGRVVLLDFWATWCGPCAREFPFLRELATRYPSEQFAMIGVSLDEDIEAVRKCVEEESLNWPHVFDGKGGRNGLAELYNIQFIPNTYILDAEGRILAKRIPDIQKVLDVALNIVS